MLQHVVWGPSWLLGTWKDPKGISSWGNIQRCPRVDIEETFRYYYVISRAISSAERAITLPRSAQVPQGLSCQYPEWPCTAQGCQRRKLPRKAPVSMGAAWTVRPSGSYKFWIQCGIWVNPPLMLVPFPSVLFKNMSRLVFAGLTKIVKSSELRFTWIGNNEKNLGELIWGTEESNHDRCRCSLRRSLWHEVTLCRVKSL